MPERNKLYLTKMDHYSTMYTVSRVHKASLDGWSTIS